MEWVFAARFAERDTPARYPWEGSYPPTVRVGNFADAQISDTLANVVAGYNDGYRVSAPVGSFPTPASGFHDMGGNVAEWTNDYYAVYPGQAGKLVQDPTGPVQGKDRIMRGGGWSYQAPALRATERWQTVPHQRMNHCGFRLVVDLA